LNLDGDESYPVADTLVARGGVPFVFSTTGYNQRSLGKAIVTGSFSEGRPNLGTWSTL